MHIITSKHWLVCLSAVLYASQATPIAALLHAHRNALFCSLESVLNPNISLIVEKDCSLGMFNRELGTNRTGVLRMIGGRLRLDQGMTRDYTTGNTMPGAYRYVIHTPYLPPMAGSIYYDYLDSDRLDRDTANLFYKALKTLYDSGIEHVDCEAMVYDCEKSRECEYIYLNMKGIGAIHQTRYRKKNKIMEELEDLCKRVVTWGRLSGAAVMERTTVEILKILEKMKIATITDETVMGEPGLIPLLFPYKMVEIACGARVERHLITVGVDLSGIEGSGLERYFDMSKERMKDYKKYYTFTEVELAG